LISGHASGRDTLKMDHSTALEPENLFGSMPLRDYVEIGRRRKWWIILPSLAIFICAAVVVRRLPNTYRAQTVILVDPQEVPATYVTSTVSSTVSDRLSAINQEVLSPERLQRLVDKLGLYPQLRGHVSNQQIIANMQRSITVDVANPGGGRLSAFTIAFSGRNPQEVASVTNELAQAFIQENLKVREQQSDGTAEFLANELADTKSQLDAKQQQIQQIKGRYIQDLPESQQYHLEALTNLQNQLRASQDHVAQAQQEKVLLQSMSGNNAPTVDLDNVGNAGSPYESQIEKLEADIATQRLRYGPSFPDLRKAQAQLDDLKAKAAAEAKKQPENPDPPPPTTLSGQPHNPVLVAQLGKLDEQIQDETRRQAEFQENINFHVQKLEQAPVFEQQISGLMRDYDALNHQYASLLDKKLAAEMSSALESRQKAERFVVLDEAKVPDAPSAPNRPLLYLAGLVGGLLGGLGLAVLMEVTDESVRSEKEAARILGAPVLVGVPRILSGKEQILRRLGVSAALAGTAFCSAAIGLLISRFISLPF
jgi:succinoglycan biosynthesis transport protein ExoP